ncbi:enoyl-ACP reductase [Ehrlichia muris AS145]|uniref:Enoyl-[acyl-carrier-protein] reductase [NADH] n=2 Tax=Ehrlichia muris TaxID=35795 RepID=V9R5Q3_9RICK|nr:enoyl-ACP reductase [Ehrlichia muris AS145]
MLASDIMKGKKGLIIGIANDKSLAWGIAKTLAMHGADIAVTYLSDVFKKRIDPLVESIGVKLVLQCDVSKEDTVDSMFAQLSNEWESIDFLVHAVAFSDKNELKGRYIDTSLNNFLTSMHISCYSLTYLAKKAEKVMCNGGSILTLSYYGAQKVMPHYNVMGVCKAALEASVKYLAVDLGSQNIRVNAISAGPVRTLASSGIGDFHYILTWNKYNAPLRRNTTIEDVGGAALYLLSDLGKGTTGEILYVDSGYHAIGMKAIDAPDINYIEAK